MSSPTLLALLDHLCRYRVGARVRLLPGDPAEAWTVSACLAEVVGRNGTRRVVDCYEVTRPGEPVCVVSGDLIEPFRG